MSKQVFFTQIDNILNWPSDEYLSEHRKKELKNNKRMAILNCKQIIKKIEAGIF
jgi:hypothetical protein